MKSFAQPVNGRFWDLGQPRGQRLLGAAGLVLAATLIAGGLGLSGGSTVDAPSAAGMSTQHSIVEFRRGEREAGSAPAVATDRGSRRPLYVQHKEKRLER
jgi:hypothetical protein